VREGYGVPGHQVSMWLSACVCVCVCLCVWRCVHAHVWVTEHQVNPGEGKHKNKPQEKRKTAVFLSPKVIWWLLTEVCTQILGVKLCKCVCIICVLCWRMCLCFVFVSSDIWQSKKKRKKMPWRFLFLLVYNFEWNLNTGRVHLPNAGCQIVMVFKRMTRTPVSGCRVLWRMTI